MEESTYMPSREELLFFKDYSTYITSVSKGSSNESKEIMLPLYIFRNGLSGLEAISKYLKENANLRFCEIAKLLNRDDRTIWDAYNNAKSKSHKNSADDYSEIAIPASYLNNRSFSVLESITSFLKDEMNMRYCKIACLLGKDQRTIWTVYNRAAKKRRKCQAN
jgi:hypothetical protein